jgi:hypothetical protein
VNLAALDFTPVPRVSAAKGAPAIKVRVLATGALQLCLNAPAYAKFGRPAALAVSAASGPDGAAYLKLEGVAAGDGLPVTRRLPPRARDGGDAGEVATCRVAAHPFTPGVVHRAQDVEVTWCGPGDADAVLTLPDWKAMRAALGVDADDA